jgi:hypothetical protein
MAVVEVTRQAREELRELIETRQLPGDTGQRVSRSLVILGEFPRGGKPLRRPQLRCRDSRDLTAP